MKKLQICWDQYVIVTATGQGAVLPSGSGDSGLRDARRSRDEAVTTVALSEAQGERRVVRAFPERTAVGGLRPYPPCANDQGPSVGEGMISSESRMRENRTSGLMSGGLETRPSGAGLRPIAKALESPPDPVAGAPALDSTKYQAAGAFSMA